MASPQLENGYTKIANELLDVLMRHPEVMKGSLFQVIAVVWRKTYGWDKKEDSISISQFVDRNK
jgi:phage replication O-like protein O